MALTDAQKDCTVLDARGRVRILLAGAVTKGDSVGYATGWKRALSTVGTAIQGRLVALQDGAIGETIEAAAMATLGGNRFSGCTPGARVYVEEGATAGKWTETAPSTTGDCNVAMGMCLDATNIFVNPGLRGPDTVA